MRVGVCLFVKNEAHDLAEWLAYQHVVGFDTVIAYDNASTDDTLGVLRRAGREQDVRAIEWGMGDPKRAQIHVYAHCLQNFGSEFDWIAFFDADEFAVPHAGSIKHVLDGVGDASALILNWAMFGSSGHVDYPADLVIEAFTWRRAIGNRNVKSVVRPMNVVAPPLNPHLFPVSGREVWPDGSVVAWLPEKPTLTEMEPDFRICQLNHYFTRSYRHWQDKVARGHLGRQNRRLDQFDWADFHELEDASAVRFAPAVKAQMERFGVPLRHRPASVIQP